MTEQEICTEQCYDSSCQLTKSYFPTYIHSVLLGGSIYVVVNLYLSRVAHSALGWYP